MSLGRGVVSGFQRDGSFQLTATKADYWHREHGACDGLPSGWPDHVVGHLLLAGFEVDGQGPGRDARSRRAFLVVRGEALSARDTGPIFAALSGELPGAVRRLLRP